MQTLHALKELKATPRQLAAQIGRDALNSTITALIGRRQVSVSRLERLADGCGRGKYLVRNTPEFQAARWLCSK